VVALLRPHDRGAGARAAALLAAARARPRPLLLAPGVEGAHHLSVESVESVELSGAAAGGRGLKVPITSMHIASASASCGGCMRPHQRILTSEPTMR
jgi:hypothetical protein